MKSLKHLFGLFLLLISCSLSHAQFNPYSEEAKMLTFGIGVSRWGTPIFARYEHPIADNITVGGTFSYQTEKESYFGYNWKHNIIGIAGRGDYHFNELLKVNDSWDIYSGAGLGFYVWHTKLDGGIYDDGYAGAGSGGVALDFHIGGRYFFNEKFAVNLELGGGTIISAGTVGVTIVL